MIPDNPTTTSSVVTRFAIPAPVVVFPTDNNRYGWECEQPGCDDTTDAGPVNDAILGAALHSFTHNDSRPSEPLSDVLAEAAGTRYLFRFPLANGAGDVVVHHPHGLLNVEAHCEACDWTCNRWSQPHIHAVAAIHAVLGHPRYKPVPDDLLDEFDEALAGRRAEQITAAVTAAEQPLQQQITQLRHDAETTAAAHRTEITELRSKLEAAELARVQLIGDGTAARLEKEIDRADAQIARSDVKPGVVLAGLAVAAGAGLPPLSAGNLPLSAAIAGWLAAAAAAVGAVLLVLSVLPRITGAWGGFGMVAVAELSTDQIVARARELATDPKAGEAADAQKIQRMSALGMHKHKLVRWGIITALAGGGSLAAAAFALGAIYS